MQAPLGNAQGSMVVSCPHALTMLLFSPTCLIALHPGSLSTTFMAPTTNLCTSHYHWTAWPHQSPRCRHWRGTFHRQAAYSTYIADHGDVLNNIMDILDTGSHDCILRASQLLHDLVHDAAKAAGMLRVRRCGGSLRPLPFSTTALAVRDEIRTARKQGNPVSPGLRKLWRQHVRDARLEAAAQQHTRIKHWLRDHPRIFWSTFRRHNASPSADGLHHISNWRAFFASKFGDVVPPAQHNQPTQPIPTNPHCPLMHPVTELDVALAFKQLGSAKASGADNIPAEFITKARTDVGGPLFHQIMARMCNVVLQLGHVPAQWKTKLISPVFKAGARHDMSNYRPIAVATTFYRIFTAIFARRLTAYLHHEPAPTRLLDCQFAFRKYLSTDHAHLVLTTCCNAALSRKQPLALVKLDISKAYDTVSREKLVAHLASGGLPRAFCLLDARAV